MTYIELKGVIISEEECISFLIVFTYCIRLVGWNMFSLLCFSKFIFDRIGRQYKIFFLIFILFFVFVHIKMC